MLAAFSSPSLKTSAEISDLTNSGLLTIGRHYTLMGSSAFLHFGLPRHNIWAPHIPKCTTKAKKPLLYKDFRLFFNDKKKTVGRYDCINLLFLIWSGLRGSNPPPSPWQGDALPNELNPQRWCLRSESNQRHGDFQSPALPTELQRHKQGY